jgi:hypothetical protein
MEPLNHGAFWIALRRSTHDQHEQKKPNHESKPGDGD